MRIVLGILGFLMLIWAVWGKTFRWGLYDFNDDSDIVLNHGLAGSLQPLSVLRSSSERSCTEHRNERASRSSMSDMGFFVKYGYFFPRHRISASAGRRLWLRATAVESNKLNRLLPRFCQRRPTSKGKGSKVHTVLPTTWAI